MNKKIIAISLVLVFLIFSSYCIKSSESFLSLNFNQLEEYSQDSLKNDVYTEIDEVEILGNVVIKFGLLSICYTFFRIFIVFLIFKVVNNW